MRTFSLTALVFVGALGLALGCGTESRGGGGGGGGGGNNGGGNNGGGNNGGGNNGGDNGGGNDGGTPTGGTTECGPEGGSVTCQAGQYCEDPRFAECQNGCLANSNCLSNQTCDLDDGSPGTCKNNEANPDVGGGGANKEAVCAKLK